MHDAGQGDGAGGNAVAYIGDEEVSAEHIGGPLVTQPGYLTSVVGAMDNGAVLRLADGSTVSIPQYDQYNTRYWLPPYRALVTGNRTYLWNLKKGKRVSISVR